MRIVLLLACVFCICLIPAAAQHEADNWYFGRYAGVSFKTGSPTVLSDSKMYAAEGSATISDRITGALLFYTRGDTIWNRAHQVMANGTGLKSGPSSSQNSLIIQNPGNRLQYYVVTVPNLTSGNQPTATAMYYSIVSLESPMGVVISKNNMLADSVSEKLTGTIDCDGSGFWVLAHHATQGIFYSYHITPKGISTTPVVSLYTTATKNTSSGCMKISPDNSKIAITSLWEDKGNNQFNSSVSLFNFNASTGEVTNYMQLGKSVGSNSAFYGISFSPDNTKLYVTNFEGMLIYQYEVNLPDVASIQSSVFTFKGLSTIIGGIQLAPDGKIYFTQSYPGNYVIPYNYYPYLGSIDNPNAKGEACDYHQNSILLSPGETQLGLPNFMDYIFNSTGAVAGPLSGCTAPHALAFSDSNCVGKPLIFNDRSTFRPTSRLWTFENGTPITSTDSIASVVYSQAGTFSVRLIVTNDKGSDTIFTKAVVLPNPTANAGVDKYLCKYESTQIGAAPEPNNTYSWQPVTNLDDPRKADPIASPTVTTEYIVSVTNSNGCVSFDTIVIHVFSIAEHLSRDTAVCIGTPVQLLASGASTYSWSPIIGLDNPTIPNPIATPLSTTTYTLIATNGTCTDTASVTITVNPLPTANAGEDQFICFGDKTTIGSEPIAGNVYSWLPIEGLDNPMSSKPLAAPVSTTQYILSVTNNTGCIVYDTLLLTVGSVKALVSSNITFCRGSGVQLWASGGNTYLWTPSAGLNDPTIAQPLASPNSTTRYKVLVSSLTCVDSNFVTVTVVQTPIADAGPDTSICLGEIAQIGVSSIDGDSYSWTPTTGLSSPNAAKTTATPNETTSYILTVTNSNGCIAADTVIVNIYSPIDSVLTLNPPIITTIPGQLFQTSLHIPSRVRTWSAGLVYDKTVMNYSAIHSTTNGITAQATNEQNGEVTIKGAGGNGEVVLEFSTFLPFSLDTMFTITLNVDSSRTTSCGRIAAQGNTIIMGEYCSRALRRVTFSEKKYFLTTKDRSIDFGVGLLGNVRLELFDYIGNSVLVVSDGALEAGEYSVALDLPVGVYYCRMRAGMYESVGKVLIAR